MTPSEVTPTASVGRLISPSCRTTTSSLPKNLVPPASTPSSLGNWPTMMTRARPATNPVSTGRAKKSAMNPARARPVASSSTPTRSASSAESAMKRPPSPSASGATTAAEYAATAELGPTVSCRQVPRAAYASSGASAVNRPVWGGIPASEA